LHEVLKRAEVSRVDLNSVDEAFIGLGISAQGLEPITIGHPQQAVPRLLQQLPSEQIQGLPDVARSPKLSCLGSGRKRFRWLGRLSPSRCLWCLARHDCLSNRPACAPDGSSQRKEDLGVHL